MTTSDCRAGERERRRPTICAHIDDFLLEHAVRALLVAADDVLVAEGLEPLADAQLESGQRVLRMDWTC